MLKEFKELSSSKNSESNECPKFHFNYRVFLTLHGHPRASTEPVTFHLSQSRSELLIQSDGQSLSWRLSWNYARELGIDRIALCRLSHVVASLDCIPAQFPAFAEANGMYRFKIDAYRAVIDAIRDAKCIANLINCQPPLFHYKISFHFRV